MKTELVMELAKPAKKRGGDRYECLLKNGDRAVIYWPQSISRSDGKIAKQLKVVVQPA